MDGKLRFVSLGSGSSGNCYVLERQGWALMIDAGVPPRRLKALATESGAPLGLVKALLLTHDHADHVRAAARLAKRWGWPVYAAEAVHDAMARSPWLGEPIPASLRHGLRLGERRTFGLFEVEPFAVPHDATETWGYVVETGNVRLLIATDVGSVTEDLIARLPSAQYVVLESNYDPMMLAGGSYPAFLKRRIVDSNGHLSNDETAHVLAAHLGDEARRVWLCHLSQENNRPELATQTVRNALLASGREHVVVEALPRTSASLVYELECDD